MQRNIRGITLIGFLVLLCVAGFFAYMVMRLMPMYVEYFGVLKAMEMVKNEPGAAQKSLEEIRRELMLKFDTAVRRTKPTCRRRRYSLSAKAALPTLRIAYEKRVPFMYNIDLVASFDKSVNLANAGAE